MTINDKHTSLQKTCPHRVVVKEVGASRHKGQVRLRPSFVVNSSAGVTGLEGAVAIPEVDARGDTAARIVDDDTSPLVDECVLALIRCRRFV